MTLFLLSPLLKWLTLSTIVGAGGIALFFLLPAWVSVNLRWLCLQIGIGALVVGAFFWYAFHAGESHMAQRIAAKDAAAIERVNRGAIEVEACNGGIDWDVVTGTCQPGSGESK